MTELKHKILLLIYAYCKNNYNNNKATIPQCIKHLIAKYLLARHKLFNFKYLGNNKRCDTLDWEGYLGRSTLTSILAGITIQFDLLYDFKINVGTQFGVQISLKDGVFKSNMNKQEQTITSMKGNIWKFPEDQQFITILLLLSREKMCNCYHREGNQVSIYLLNEESATKSLCAYYKDIWTQYPIPGELRNDQTAKIQMIFNSTFSYDLNEDVSIQFTGRVENITNFNSLIPIDNCAQGWLCCYSAFH